MTKIHNGQKSEQSLINQHEWPTLIYKCGLTFVLQKYFLYATHTTRDNKNTKLRG